MIFFAAYSVRESSSAFQKAKPPQNCLSHWGTGHPSNSWFLGSRWVYPNWLVHLLHLGDSLRRVHVTKLILPHLTSTQLTSFYLYWVCCDWSQPWQTGCKLWSDPVCTAVTNHRTLSSAKWGQLRRSEMRRSKIGDTNAPLPLLLADDNLVQKPRQHCETTTSTSWNPAGSCGPGTWSFLWTSPAPRKTRTLWSWPKNIQIKKSDPLQTE